MIDERTRAALGRLTENERACLMRRLHHQTAKEMAIDLGISPHAVEKRLKMARTKLGVSSSLEAARLLEASEGYGQPGPQTSDLGPEAAARQESVDPVTPRPAWRRTAPYVLTGAIAMSLAVIVLLTVAPLNAPLGGVAPLPVGGTARLPQDGPAPSVGNAASPVIGSTLTTVGELNRQEGKTSQPPQMVKASPEIVRMFVNETFDSADKNHSGYIERDEAPQTLLQSTVVHKGPMGDRPFVPDDKEQVNVMKGPAAQAAYLATMDEDADGKVSRAEYQAANFPRFMGWGVPANWNGAPKVAAK